MKTELKETGFFSPGNAALSADNIFSIIREAGKRAGLAVKHILICYVMPVVLLWLTMVSIPDYFRIIWVIEIFSILSDTQPVMLLVLKVWKSLVKTVPSDSKCQIPTFSSILP